MEFNKKFIFLLTLLLLASFCSPLYAENFQNLPSDLSEKSNAELIALVREIKEDLGMDPGNADLYYKLSEVYTTLFDRTRKKSAESTGWLLKSSAALEKAVMLQPGHKTALYNLGVVYKRLGKMERARDELRKASRASDPEADGFLLVAIWMQIGMIYEEQGFYDAAKEAYETALDYDYGNDDVRGALLDLKDRKKAAAALGSPSSYNISPGGFGGPMGSAARSYDPMSGADTEPQGLGQMLPALGSMFSGGGSSGVQSGQDYYE